MSSGFSQGFSSGGEFSRQHAAQFRSEISLVVAVPWRPPAPRVPTAPLPRSARTSASSSSAIVAASSFFLVKIPVRLVRRARLRCATSPAFEPRKKARLFGAILCGHAADFRQQDGSPVCGRNAHATPRCRARRCLRNALAQSIRVRAETRFFDQHALRPSRLRLQAARAMTAAPCLAQSAPRAPSPLAAAIVACAPPGCRSAG